MHLAIDAVAVRRGSSAIVVEHLLAAWTRIAPNDEITVIAGPEGPAFPTPPTVHTRVLQRPRGALGGLWLRSLAVRRATRALGADAVLVGVPASSLTGNNIPRGLILYDLRHELRPHQFTRGQRIARRIFWGWSMSRADAIYTISERTLSDLRNRHPRLGARGIATVLGADHVDTWPKVARAERPYALAFGHFSNKNAGAVIAGWAEACRTHAVGRSWTLRLVGMGAYDREIAAQNIAEHGMSGRIELMPWLDDDAFRASFSGARLILFPSDFEGYGLPAVEALRLGIPLVVSGDEALAEVTGGHAVVTDSVAPNDIAAAISQAIQLAPQQLDEGRLHTNNLTWEKTATKIRASLDALLSTSPVASDNRR